MRKYNFEIETLESGQRNAYGDSYYHYIIEDKNENKHSEFTVKRFCTQFLEPSRYSESEYKALDKNKDFGLNFAPYYTKFEKISRNKYVYKVVRPSTH